ncbi:Sialidase [Lasiosphaeria miniovina]|uniref:Sialidase n=1 Tax=Lasiosphaeria miniovina TaxID=1954250 RepID=A0AA40A500_9PEZI|nr:Sialidase [Lasiosphaeria miniovina]KAK0709375.1 Sialidase [Lasiosphaeria miniovina]
MRFSQILPWLAAAVGPVVAADGDPWSLFTDKVVFDGRAQNLSASYPRLAELEDGTLLATTGLFGATPAFFPVFESTDGGIHWAWVSNITDQVNGWGMSAQPAIIELTEPLGGFPAGTVLASGNSWHPDSSNSSTGGTKIDLYASTDKARTWQFVSHIAQGGAPNTTNGATPIWEPFLMVYGRSLAAYYSDQRDPLHGQKLAHQVSTDLRTWGSVVNDVAYDLYMQRPGMTVVAHIPPIDKYILVYENPAGNSSSHGSHYPVYYRLSDSPLTFDAAEGVGIEIGGAFAPNAAPYVVWSPAGGPNGTVVVSDADYSTVYTNTAGGDPAAWQRRAVPQPSAYSRALLVFKEHPDHLMLLSGGTFDGPEPKILTASVVSLTAVLGGDCLSSAKNTRRELCDPEG